MPQRISRTFLLLHALQLVVVALFFVAIAWSTFTPSSQPIDAGVHHKRSSLSERAPDGSYDPETTRCPANGPTIRNATVLNPDESNYISARMAQGSQPLLNFLTAANVTGDFKKYFNNATLQPNTAVAFSGGGYRAMLNGAGFFATLDNRTSDSVFSGVLQGMNYIAGLSGGSWLVGASSIPGQANVGGFATVDEMQANVWDLTKNLFVPGSDLDVLEYLVDIRDQVRQKSDSKYKTSLTDYWGLAIGRHTAGNSNGGTNVSWSDIKNTAAFQNSQIPFPLIIATSLRPNELVPELVNGTIYELSPFEFGSWDEGVPYFLSTENIGTAMIAGKPPGLTECVFFFDVAAFFMGTSSSLFESGFFVLIEAVENILGNGTIARGIIEIINDILDGTVKEIVADYPNPFFEYDPNGNSVANLSLLSLVDGGTDTQNIPLWPLLQPERAVDFIYATDSSADTVFNWPNGTSLAATFHRIQQNPAYKDIIPFPFIPDTNTFMNLGLVKRPTFFGCNATNYTSKGLPVPPMIVYHAMAPWSWYSNTSTFQLQYADLEVDGFLANGEANILQGGDANWPTCFGCALLQRSKERAGDPVGAQCEACFQKYCWDGTLAPAPPPVYAPSLLNGSSWPFAAQASEVAKVENLTLLAREVQRLLEGF